MIKGVILNKRSKADFTVGNIHFFVNNISENLRKKAVPSEILVTENIYSRLQNQPCFFLQYLSLLGFKPSKERISL